MGKRSVPNIMQNAASRTNCRNLLNSSSGKRCLINGRLYKESITLDARCMTPRLCSKRVCVAPGYTNDVRANWRMLPGPQKYSMSDRNCPPQFFFGGYFQDLFGQRFELGLLQGVDSFFNILRHRAETFLDLFLQD